MPTVNRIRLPVVSALIATALSLIPYPAAGSEGGTAYLFGMDSSQFPQISAYLSVADALGGRLAGLTVQDIALREDGSPAMNTVLTEELTGVRLVAVVDPGLDMLYALPDGETRIQRVRRAMSDWLGTLPDGGIDDLTLITPDGTAVSHTSDPETFLSGLRAFAPKIPAKRTLDALLVDALGAAADPFPRPGMRALLIVFSASKLAESGNAGRGLCPRALELHVPVFGIWSGRAEPSAKPQMEALAALASDCGGYSVALESSTGTATLLSMIASQRAQYRLEYRSSAASSGEHALAATVARADFQTETAPLTFTLEVEPPAVSWIDFPDRLTRRGGEISQPVESYQPDAIELRADVTFPDGHPRAILSTQLFADGELVGECTADPCPGLRLDLSRYAESAAVKLQIVVRDELGLEGKTAERSLSLTVERPTFWEVFRAYYLLPVAVVLAVSASIGVLIAAVINFNRVRAAQAESGLLFPGGRSAVLPKDGAWRDRMRDVLRRRRKPAAPPEETYAVLEEIGGIGRVLEIAASDVIVGRDPLQAGVVLDDPSVSPRHARIVRMGDGIPWIFDLGSAAGSWRNFDEVPPEGALLREGDRLNFGRAAFRVRLKPCAPDKEIMHEA